MNHFTMLFGLFLFAVNANALDCTVATNQHAPVPMQRRLDGNSQLFQLALVESDFEIWVNPHPTQSNLVGIGIIVAGTHQTIFVNNYLIRDNNGGLPIFHYFLPPDGGRNFVHLFCNP